MYTSPAPGSACLNPVVGSVNELRLLSAATVASTMATWPNPICPCHHDPMTVAATPGPPLPPPLLGVDRVGVVPLKLYSWSSASPDAKLSECWISIT